MAQRFKIKAPEGYKAVIERAQGSDFKVLLAKEPSGLTGDKMPKFSVIGNLSNQKGRLYAQILTDALRIVLDFLADESMSTCGVCQKLFKMTQKSVYRPDGTSLCIPRCDSCNKY